jgi:Fic family protein
MDETILTPRQQFLINLVSSGNGVTSKYLEEQTQGKLPASKPTIARDLAFLAQKKLIKVVGKARQTRYFPAGDNPLLKYFDLDKYFETDPDKRLNAKTAFDPKVFSHLKNLFSENEIRETLKQNKSFSQESQKNGKEIYLKELERFIIELSWKSSKIEGNTYDLLDTEVLLKQGIEAEGHSKDEALMILNHKRAFEEILAHKNTFKKITLSQVLQLHNFLVKGLDVSTGIRTKTVGITGTVYQPLGNQWQIRENLEKLIKVINSLKFPLEKALVTVAGLSYLQPFVDGNKRTARILANAILLAWDYYPLSYRSVDEKVYKKAVVLFYEQNSLFYLKKILVDQYNFALRTYFK